MTPWLFVARLPTNHDITATKYLLLEKAKMASQFGDAAFPLRDKTPTSSTQSSGSRTIPALTGIRFFAAVYVFTFHFGASALDSAGAPRQIATLLHNGFFGVSAFFVLSGFILAHAHPKTFSSSIDYFNYAISRFGRIYPTYLFALILALPLAIESLKPKSALAVLFMIQSWGGAISDTGYSWIMQAWTLSVELGFYILFPFLVNRFRRLSQRTLIAFVLIDAVVLIAGALSTIRPGTVTSGGLDITASQNVPSWLLYVPLPLTRLPEFILGVLFHCIVRDLPRSPTLRTNIAMYLVTALTLAVLSSTPNGHVVSIATVLVGGLIALIYKSEASGFTAFLGCRTLRVLGSASYALYLLQGPLHAYMLMFVASPYGRILALPVTVVASIAVWHFIEEPCRIFMMPFRIKDETTDVENIKAKLIEGRP